MEGLSADARDGARAELLALRGRIAMYRDDQETAYQTLLEAARLLEPEDAGRAAELLSEAIGSAIQLGSSAMAEAAARIRALPGDQNPVRDVRIAQALLSAASVAGDPEGEQRDLAHVLAAAEADGVLDRSPQHLLAASRAHLALARNDEAADLARRALDRARQDSALALVVRALWLLAWADFDRGRWGTAYAAAGEAVELGQELEQRATVCACLGLLADIEAARGDEDACRAHATAAIEVARATALGYYREWAERALGRLELARGEAGCCDPAARAGQRAPRASRQRRDERDAGLGPRRGVRAYGRAGQGARIARSREASMPPISPAEEATIQRCRGIVADEGAFEAPFERALALDDAEPFPFERARTMLVYGERLRRAGERRRARERLRAAVTAFEDLGATAWGARARSELAATGERLRAGPVARESLTPRELQVALAVAEGASNAEVAAARYLTPKTVESHLTHVYRKLGLRSRAELAREFARRVPLE